MYCKKKGQVSGPCVLRAESDPVGALELAVVLFGKKRQVSGPRALAESDRVGAPEPAVVLFRKKRQVSSPRALRARSGRVGALERAVVLLRKETTQLLDIPSVGQSVTIRVF